MKKKSLLISVLTIALLVASVGVFASADGEDTYKSQGSIVFTNDTDNTSDDVVFDASDFTTIDTMITDGKTSLATSLNQYPNSNVTPLSTFPEIASAVDNLTAVPDIYYYDKATEGDSCVRYMYEDGSYYPCNEYGEKTSDTALSGTITVVTKDDTTEPAAGEIQLVKYESTSAANLSAGSAGYADKSFILGSGSDNITYRNSFINAQLLFSSDIGYEKTTTITTSEEIKVGVISISMSHDNSIPSECTITTTGGTVNKLDSIGGNVYSKCRGEIFFVQDVPAGAVITMERESAANVCVIYLLKIG